MCNVHTVHCTTNWIFEFTCFHLFFIEIIDFFSLFLSCLNSIVFNSTGHQSLWIREEEKAVRESFIYLVSFDGIFQHFIELSNETFISKRYQDRWTINKWWKIPYSVHYHIEFICCANQFVSIDRSQNWFQISKEVKMLNNIHIRNTKKK